MLSRIMLMGGCAVMSLLLMSVDAEAAKGKKKKKDPETMFKTLDANNDGSLSKEEFSKFGKKAKKADKIFTKLDADNDGKISKTEFEKVKDLKKDKKKKK